MDLLRDWFRRSFSDPQVVILGLFLVIGLAIVVGLGTWLAPMFASIVIAYLLEAIVEDRGLLAEVDADLRERFLIAAGQVSRPDKRARKALARARQRSAKRASG